MVETVANAADQVNAESNNVSATAEQQTTTLTQVSRNVDTLATRADDLSRQLKQFTLTSPELDADRHESRATDHRPVNADGGWERSE
jgi:hypothetical protein